MQVSLSNLVDNLSEISNKEPKNTFTDSMRSMADSLSQSIDKVSEIYREISQIDKKFTDNIKDQYYFHYYSQLIKYYRFLKKSHKLIRNIWIT